jgi:hypothetical protein
MRDWSLWSQSLHYLETVDRLMVPWVTYSHQAWSSFSPPHTHTHTVHMHTLGSWTKYSPILKSTPYHTRASLQHWYPLETPIQSHSPHQQLYPASILLDLLYHNTMFHISVSASYIPHQGPVAEPGHIISGDEYATPHPYYLELLQWDDTDIMTYIGELG